MRSPRARASFPLTRRAGSASCRHALLRMPRSVALVALLALLAGALCAAPPAAAQNETPARVLAAAKSWGYQLQNIDRTRSPTRPTTCSCSTIRDGTDEQALTAAEVERLKRKPTAAVVSCCAICRSGRRRNIAITGNGTGAGCSAGSPPMARPPEHRVARQLRRALLARGLAEDHFSGPNSYLDRIMKQGLMASISTRSMSMSRWPRRTRMPHR